MDLRPFLQHNDDLLQEGIALIQRGEMWYQPFILADGIEVGEGQNMEDWYEGCISLLDNNVYLDEAHRHLWKGNTRKLAENGTRFAACNRKYRLCYERAAEIIMSRLGGDLSEASFVEIGCNTGLTLFNLAVRGARECIGIDWTDHGRVFAWLNKLLKTDVRFISASYDNLSHTIPEVDVPVVDVVLNTIFVNHQSDPMHFLCYLADRAKKGLFLWILFDERGSEMTIRYGEVAGVHDLGAGKPFPLSFHNDIVMSKALLVESLRQLGFGEVEFIEHPTEWELSPPRCLIPHKMLYARRTHDVRSAFSQKGDINQRVKKLLARSPMIFGLRRWKFW